MLICYPRVSLLRYTQVAFLMFAKVINTVLELGVFAVSDVWTHCTKKCKRNLGQDLRQALHPPQFYNARLNVTTYPKLKFFPMNHVLLDVISDWYCHKDSKVLQSHFESYWRYLSPVFWPSYPLLSIGLLSPIRCRKLLGGGAANNPVRAADPVVHRSSYGAILRSVEWFSGWA